MNSCEGDLIGLPSGVIAPEPAYQTVATNSAKELRIEQGHSQEE